MKFLDQYFTLMTEGSADKEYRKKALDTQQKALDGLKTLKPADLGLPQSGKNAVSVNLGDIVDDKDLEDLELWFVMKDEKTKGVAGAKLDTQALFRGATKNAKKRIEIYVDVPEDKKNSITTDVWKKIIAKNASTILGRTKETFWHEFIHYMDHKRIGSDPSKKKIFKTTGKDPKDYYNHPLETNAFIQQGLSRVEDHLKGLKNKGDVQKLIGKDANQFYSLMLKVLPKSFVKNLSDKNKMKLKKRVAQMWTDTMEKFDNE